ncbi:MAG: DUF2189 domain-containing protein [Hyphomicrobiaceae bacterium]
MAESAAARGIEESENQSSKSDAVARPNVRKVPFDAPWDWLAAGWRDLWTIPQVSLTYGLVFSVIAVLLTYGLVSFGWQSLILALAGGFLIVGPFVATGLYDTSRRIGAGEPVSLSTAARAASNAKGQLSFMGAILFFALYVWVQLALLLFMLFIGSRGLPPASEFIPTLLFTPHGLGLLVVGTAVGAVLAVVVFSISAVSVPLLMTRRIDAVSAISVSVEAVRRNPEAMGLWAALIAGFIALGILTLFVGLVIAFPLIGHATWHAYRALVIGTDAEDDS